MKEIHYVTADEAVAAIRSGDHIHLGSVASVPHVLIDALVRRADAGDRADGFRCRKTVSSGGKAESRRI